MFMTTLVACNYWLVCTTFPALIVVHHRHSLRVARAVRWLSRGWRVTPCNPCITDTSVAENGVVAAAAATAAATTAAVVAGMTTEEEEEEEEENDHLEVDVICAYRAPATTPTPPSPTPSSSQRWGGSRHHRRAMSYVPSSVASYSFCSTTADGDNDAADLFLSAPLLPPRPPPWPLSSSSTSPQHLPIAPPPTELFPPRHRRCSSLNLDDELRRRHRRRPSGQQQQQQQ